MQDSRYSILEKREHAIFVKTPSKYFLTLLSKDYRIVKFEYQYGTSTIKRKLKSIIYPMHWIKNMRCQVDIHMRNVLLGTKLSYMLFIPLLIGFQLVLVSELFFRLSGFGFAAYTTRISNNLNLHISIHVRTYVCTSISLECL